jgi:hypothetical protein
MNDADNADADDPDDADSVAFVIAFVICVELSKEPEYQCEYCDKVYKQEARYITHLKSAHPPPAAPDASDAGGWRVEKDTLEPASAVVEPMLDNTIIVELLRQNREMLELLRKQQETIHLLVMNGIK